MNKDYQMTFKQRMIVWVLLLAVVFGAGFWLGYQQVRSLRPELRTAESDLAKAQVRINELEYQARLAQIRQLAALMYAETHRQNYDVAANYSTRYFNELRRAADVAENPTVRNALEELLNTRDTITAELARAGPSALDYVQALFLKTNEATTTEQQPDTAR